MISAIVAVDSNWGIGFNGDLLEHIPEDLKYFKALTTDKMVIMGRKTWDSLPKKPLPNRLNIVITHRDDIEHDNDVIFCDLETAKKLIVDTNELVPYAEIFVIGGGIIYKELLPFCDRVYVTKIFKDHYNVDTYFPNLDEAYNWTPGMCSSLREYEDITYQFVQYDRI